MKGEKPWDTQIRKKKRNFPVHSIYSSTDTGQEQENLEKNFIKGEKSFDKKTGIMDLHHESLLS
jgi:hypothetical protein